MRISKTLKSIKNSLIILNLNFFTSGSECNGIEKDENGYFFIKDDRKYTFKLLSETYLQEDKKVLTNTDKRRKQSLYGSIKVVNSNEFDNYDLLLAKTNTKFQTTLVDYEKENKHYIIDYSMNLIMNKEDYIEIFEPDLIKKFDIQEVENLKELYDLFGNSIKEDWLLKSIDLINKDLEKNNKVLKKGTI